MYLVISKYVVQCSIAKLAIAKVLVSGFSLAEQIALLEQMT